MSVEALPRRSAPYLAPTRGGRFDVATLPHTYFPDLFTRRDSRRTHRDMNDSVPTWGVSREVDAQAQKDQVMWMDLGERAANGLWLRTKSNQSPFGLELAKLSVEASNDFRMTSHGPDHWRRVEQVMKGLFFNIPEFRHGIVAPQIYDAAFVYPRMHDSDQFYRERLNLETGEKHPPKWGHGMAGAVIAFAMVPEYAQERAVSHEYAREVMGHAAIMMMKHDEPAVLNEALAGREPAWNYTESKDLYDAFKANILDLTTLSPAQMVQILKYEKGSHKKFQFIHEGSEYGLHPVIEQALGSRLKAMEQDHRPILGEIDQRTRIGLELATHAAVRADEMDMIGPEWDAVMRKLNVPKSKDRDIMKRDMTPEFMLEVIMDDRYRYDSHFEPHNDSDITRALWEQYHFGMQKEGVIAASKYGNRLFGEIAMKSTIVFKDVISKLLDGNFDPIHEQYNRRIVNMGLKILERAEVGSGIQADIMQIVQPNGEGTPINIDRFQEIVSDVLGEVDMNSKIFTDRVDGLVTERNMLIDGDPEKDVPGLREKVMNSDGSLKYTPKDKQKFITLADFVLQKLYDHHEVDALTQARLEREAADRVHALPFHTYDSSGLGVPKTLVPTIGEEYSIFDPAQQNGVKVA